MSWTGRDLSREGLIGEASTDLTAEVGPVEIESEWTAMRREGREPRLLGVHIGLAHICQTMADMGHVRIVFGK